MKLVTHGRRESLPPTMVGQHIHRYGIVGHSRAVAEVIRRIELVSAIRSTVLITGETGTGKELVACAVHNRSAQRDMPSVAEASESGTFGGCTCGFHDHTSPGMPRSKGGSQSADHLGRPRERARRYPALEPRA